MTSRGKHGSNAVGKLISSSKVVGITCSYLFSVNWTGRKTCIPGFVVGFICVLGSTTCGNCQDVYM